MTSARRRSPGWPLGRRIALAVALLLVAGSLAGAVALDSAVRLRVGPNEYNIAAWEFRNLPAKWLYEAGRLLRGSRSEQQLNADILRFFELTALIDDLEQQGDSVDREQLARLEDERDGLENHVEYAIESRISAVARDAGLTRDFLLLSDRVWPPVDFEFTDSPTTLAESPRDVIRLSNTTLLREDLTIADLEAIEEQKLREENVSARAFSTSGIGAYPTIVDYTSDYRRAVEVVAHEWLHNYLFFRPLGWNYYESGELRTMNETVADLVGRELASLVLERWPLTVPGTSGEPPPAETEGEPAVDSAAVLIELRGKVDALLADGRIAEAEALMAETRQELEEQGVYIRKINQAYFAFINLYAGEAGNPAATDPIGPKIDELRRLSPSLAAFVDIAGDLTSVEKLDAALAELRGPA